MAQTSYLIKPGTTAEDIAQQREFAQMMLRGAADTSPKGHWAHIPAQMLMGGLGGWEAGEVAGEGIRQADDAAGLISALGGGGTPGAAPGGMPGAAPGAAPGGAPGRPMAPSIGADGPGMMSPARASAGAAGREQEFAAANPDLLGMIRREEGFAPVAKWDVRQNSGGYGSRAAPGETFDRPKAEQYLQRDAAPVMAWVNRHAPAATPQQKEALLSFGYNLGVDDLEKLKPDVVAGDWQRVGQRMLSFNQAAIGPGGALQPMDALTNRRRREAAALTGGPRSIAADAGDMGGAASIGASAPSGGNELLGKLWRNPQTRPIAQAIITARMSGEKKRHVVAPGASLTDDAGNVLYQAPGEDSITKARNAAIGKGQGEARLAIPAAVSRAEETVGILDKLRSHKGIDAGTGATAPIATRVWGSDAYDFEQLRTQAQGTAFLTAIGEMRGTGAISNVEGEAATQAVARMKGAQSKEAFLGALGDYERIVRKGVANTYRQAGLPIPEGIMGPAASTPGAAVAPAGGTTSGATPGPGSASAVLDAPEGLTEGTVLRDPATNETMIVRGGKVVPMNAQPAAAANPGSPARENPFSRAKSPLWASTDDRRALRADPGLAPMFDQVFGAGAAAKVLGEKSSGPIGQGRYSYRGQ